MTVSPNSDVRDVERTMGSTPILRGVPAGAIRRLAKGGRVLDYRHGSYVFHQGDEPDDVHFLVRGRLEVTTVSPGGVRELHTTLDTPQFIGELGVVGALPRSASVLALDDSHVWSAPGEDFLSFLAGEPGATKALLRALARQLRESEAFVDDLLFLDLRGRVAKRLLQLVTPSLDQLPNDGAVVPSVVTHADLAALCGGSRENVTRILSDLQRRRVIAREGRRYRLVKIGALAKLAGL